METEAFDTLEEALACFHQLQTRQPTGYWITLDRRGTYRVSDWEEGWRRITAKGDYMVVGFRRK